MMMFLLVWATFWTAFGFVAHSLCAVQNNTQEQKEPSKPPRSDNPQEPLKEVKVQQPAPAEQAPVQAKFKPQVKNNKRANNRPINQNRVKKNRSKPDPPLEPPPPQKAANMNLAEADEANMDITNPYYEALRKKAKVASVSQYYRPKQKQPPPPPPKSQSQPE